MHQEQLAFRQLLLKEKPFLVQIYQFNKEQTRKLLRRSSELQLKLLCSLVFLVTKGYIPISKENFKNLKKVRKLKYLSNLSIKNINKLITDESQEKRFQFLEKFLKALPFLIAALFTKLTLKATKDGFPELVSITGLNTVDH